MRIIGGQDRGRLIRLPAGSTIRPTTDRIKKSLFDILPAPAGGPYLDLFAGSGSVGLEAISRGAGKTFFVEKDARLAEVIRASLRLLGYENRAEVVLADARKGVAGLVKKGVRFEVLFADPPYDRGYVKEIGLWLAGGELLAEGGIVVIQHSVREPLSDPPAALAVADQRRYGDTLLSFLNREKVDL